MKQIIATIFAVIPFMLFAQRNVNTVDTLPVKIFIDNNVLGKSIDGFVVIKGRKRHLLDADKMRMKTQNLPYAINCQKCPVGFIGADNSIIDWPNLVKFQLFDNTPVKFVAGENVRLETDGETITITKF